MKRHLILRCTLVLLGILLAAAPQPARALVIVASPNTDVIGAPDGSGIGLGISGIMQVIDYTNPFAELIYEHASDPNVRKRSVAHTFADLATGRMGGVVESFSVFEQIFNIIMVETLTITGEVVGVVPVEIGLTLSGFQELAPSPSGRAAASIALGVSQSNAQQHKANTGGEPSGSYERRVSFVRNVTDTNRTFDIFAAMSVSASGIGSLSDYSNTATFDITLPPGLGFSSASGVFMTQGDVEEGTVTPSLPEPATAALLIAGFAVLGHARRRRV